MKPKIVLGLIDSIKLNFMLKWFEKFGFDDVLSNHPKAQIEFAEKIFEYIE